MKVRQLSRCPSAKYSYAIRIEANAMFASIDLLRSMLGPEQYSRSDPKFDATNPRPWFFVFVKDSTEGSWKASDGSVDMRLYINDEEVAVQFKLMCGEK